MQNINNDFETYNMVYNAPFTGCFQEDKSRLFRLGAINEDETPREDVIRILARAFAAAFFDGYINRDDDGELYFVYGALSELWEKGEVYAVYLYIIFCHEAEMAGMPEKLIWFSKREDLLKLYLNSFMAAFEELVNGYEDDIDGDNDVNNDGSADGDDDNDNDAVEDGEIEETDAGTGEE